MKAEHFDFTPEGQKAPLLQGYRKLLVACVWLALALFVVLFCMLSRASSGQITLALWVVGSAGFFCSVFVVGNAVEWSKFWGVRTQASLSQKDSTHTEIVYQDSSEDAAWKQAEQK